MIGLILLDPEDNYVYSDGSLPKRPDWDKEFLINMIRGSLVLCSESTFKTIPKSMLKVATFTTDILAKADYNFGIKTFSQVPPGILIVTRGTTVKPGGKKFRLDRFTNVYKNEGIELWKNL